MFSKDHTPITRADLELFCEDEQADRSTWQSCEQVENGHGRLQRRHLLTSPDLNAYLRRDWGEVGQVFGLQRQRRSKDKHRLEVLYGWTRLAQKCCSPQRLLPFIRAHWAVENRLHWRRDVTLREDHSQVRKGNAPQVWAVLNNLILALLDFLGVQNVPKQMRVFDAQPQRAVRLLFGSLLTFR